MVKYIHSGRNARGIYKDFTERSVTDGYGDVRRDKADDSRDPR